MSYSIKAAYFTPHTTADPAAIAMNSAGTKVLQRVSPCESATALPTVHDDPVATAHKSDAELDLENRVVLAAVQALLGQISENMLAIAIETNVDENSATVYFALDHDDADDREAIEDDLPVELIAPGGWVNLDVRTQIWIGADWVNKGWPGQGHRLIFSRRR